MKRKAHFQVIYEALRCTFVPDILQNSNTIYSVIHNYRECNELQ